MKLRQKTLYLIGGAFIALLLLISLIVTRQSLEGFKQLEQKALTKDMERVTNALGYEVEKQVEYLKAWAYWTDTQHFVRGEYPEYVQDFSLDESFSVYNKHTIVFTNNDGQMIYAKEFDDAGAHELTPELRAILEPYLRRESNDLAEYSGILRVPLGFGFFTALPILDNEGKGPAAGSMISVSLLNEAYLQELATQTRLDVEMYLGDSSELPEDVAAVRDEIVRREDIPALVRPLDLEKVAAYAPLHDVDGKHVGIVRIEEERAIYQQGMRQLVLMLVSLLSVGVIVTVFVLVSLERSVLSRLSRLSRRVREISGSGQTTTRVEVAGRDELAMLATDLNAMLQVIEERTQALEQSKQDLERSNQDLERFAYIASHDLQEPLRKVQTFSDRIATKYADKLGDEGKVYINRMQESLGRMRGLIQDLLSYSRVQNSQQEVVAVDLNEVVRGVISDLEVRLEQSRGRVVVEALPTVKANPLQMRQVFQNLIGNALKFSKPDLPPVVTISAKKQNNQHEVVVSDNGIGFEQHHAERIFEVFQRLQGRGNYEGTGIGLAIVRRIVEQHGGGIRAESKVGQGSRFFLTLPATQQEHAQRDRESRISLQRS